MHHLNINSDAKPVKQQQRRFRPEIMEAIESEVKKLIDSDFIREEQHSEGGQYRSHSLKEWEDLDLHRLS